MFVLSQSLFSLFKGGVYMRSYTFVLRECLFMVLVHYSAFFSSKYISQYICEQARRQAGYYERGLHPYQRLLQLRYAAADKKMLFK